MITGTSSSAWLLLVLSGAIVLTGCVADNEGASLEEDPELADSSLRLRTHLDSARALYDNAEYESARGAWLGTLQQARALKDSTAETEALTWLGLASLQLADYAEARRWGEEALLLKRSYGLDSELARSYNALGLVAWDEGRLADAADLLRRAVDAGRSADNDRAVVVASANLGLIETDLGNFDEARRGFETLRDVGRELEDARLEGNGLTNLGMLAVTTGDPLSAIPHLTRALELYRSVEYANGEQIALAQLSAAHADLGEPRLALAALDSALRLSRAMQQRDEEGRNLEQLAALHREAGNLKHALDLYEAARLVYEDLGMDVETGTDLRSVAEIHASLGNLEGAQQHALQALELHRSAGDRWEELHDLVLLAELAHLAGRSNEVAQNLRSARQLASELDAHSIRLSVALTEARIADRDGDNSHVIEVLKRAEGDLEKAGPAAESEAHSLMARAYARLNQLDSAASSGRRAVAAVERVRGNFGSTVLRTSYIADRASVYGDLVSVLLRLGLVEEAFQVLDAARGRGLVEHLAAAQGDVEESDTSARAFTEADRLLRRIDQLVTTLAYLESLPIEERNALAVADVDERLREARAQYQARAIAAAELEGSPAALLGSKRAELPKIQRVLEPEEALVEYLVTAERVWIFVVRNGEARAFDSEIAEEDLASRIRLVRGLLADPEAPGELAHEVLEGLHSVLLGPALRSGVLADATQLIIVPHMVLNYVPFAALRDRVTGRYLVEDYGLLSLPTASALPVIRERQTGELAEADARKLRTALFAPLASSLPATRAETRAIKQTLARADEHVNARGTEQRFREALRRGDLVHAATHGVLNVRNPMFSRIELARGSGNGSRDDGRLEVHELLSMSITSPLVFLSGCETGVGAAWRTEYARGEDYATLAQAFLYAGARNVVATLWRIEDEGAAAFAGRFYEYLQRMSPSEALARAQREMMTHESYGAPYHWAGYQLAGSGELVR